MNKLMKPLCLGSVYTFLYLPIIVLIVYSFNNTRLSLLWHGFTLHWYQELFNDPKLFFITMHSLTIAFLSSTFASLLGTIAAVSLFRYRFFGKGSLQATLFVLIVLPDIVLGIALLILYSVFHIPLGFWTLLLAHITFCIPFVAVTVYSRLSDLDRHLFEAAQDLGASDFSIFRRILLPLLSSAIVAGWLLSFTMSFDDVVISFFVSGPAYQILPLEIFSMVKLGVKPEINALCSIIFIFTLILVFASQFLLGYLKSGNDHHA